MKQSLIRVTAAAAAITLVFTSVGYSFAVENQDTSASTQSETSVEENLRDSVKTMFDTTRTTDKEETVYVIAGADGAVKKVIVSDWLKNPSGAEKLNDFTQLHDIYNVKSDAGYEMDEKGACVWDAAGEDIYYQGTTDKDVPVAVSIRYTLDGKPISASDLAGKSGKVEMTFEYQNNETQQVTIDGKEETIAVPFVMLTGMMLDNTQFRNISVSNGKLINDGDRSIVVGLALPGMQENLGIDKEKFEIPDSVTISADVENFAMTTTMTVATNDVFNGLNLDGVNSLDSLKDAVKQMDDATQQLLDGSSALYDGLATLLIKSGDLVKGIKQLAGGATELKAGTASLKTGVSTLSGGAAQISGGAAQLSDGAAQLQAGLGQLDANSAALNGGAKTVFDTLLATVQKQLTDAGLQAPALTIENYKQVLSGVLAGLSDDSVRATANQQAKKAVTEAVKAQEAKIREQVTAAVQAGVKAAVLQTMQLTVEQYDAAVAAGQIPAEQQAQVDGAIAAQMASDAVKQKITQTVAAQEEKLIAAQLAGDTVKQQIAAALAKAAAGRQSIQTAVAQLDSYKQFYQGLQTYTAGVDAAYSGSQSVAAGASQLSDGAGTLQAGVSTLTDGAAKLDTGAQALLDGILKLEDGSGALITGVTQLRDGAQKLTDGMQQFRTEGIDKLTDAVDGDLGSVVARLRATVDVSKSYQSFGGISEDMNGSVKFIYRTESVE